MDCEYFGECGSCTLYELNYEEQLDFKIKRERNRFEEFSFNNFEIIKSEEQNFRYRAEFRVWKNFDDENNPIISYSMTSFDKDALEIKTCQIVSPQIANLMPKLISKMQENQILKEKIYAIEFLGSTINDMLITLIYHRKLDLKWEIEAKKLQDEFEIKIIGRSKKQKVVLENAYINEELTIDKKSFKFQYFEGGFTQPNTNVNIKMIEWVLNNIESHYEHGDLCELYCGGGNFTIPLSTKFEKVLATEISKTSINSAKTNCSLNNISNIEFIRMSSEEFVEALNEKREFRRLKDINLKDYNFSTIFMDPPRAGLDETTRNLAKNFEQIIYVSCNPETLCRDLIELNKTHQILKFAFFDQFPYTRHIESGVILTKKS